MDGLLGTLPSFDRIGTVGVLIIIAIAVITDKLVWHTRLTKMERDRDRWQRIAIDALTGPAQAGVRAAEVAVGVVQSLPEQQAISGAGED